MSYQLIEEVTLGGGASLIGYLDFTWYDYQAYSDEAYKTNPLMRFYQKSKLAAGIYQIEEATHVNTGGLAQYDYRACFCIAKIKETGRVYVYNTPDLTGVGSFTGEWGQSNQSYSDIVMQPYSEPKAALPGYIQSYTDSRCIELWFWELTSNIPIFETATDATQYIQYGDNIENAVNNTIPSEPEGREFEITCIWTEGTWTENGTYISGGAIAHHDVRGRKLTGADWVMWPAEKLVDGALIYHVKTRGDFYNCQYSEDGVVWHDAGNQFPYNFFYRERVSEIGHFKFAVSFYNGGGIPIFGSEEDADDYLDGLKPITDALNWDEISGNYPDIENPTGEPDDGTDWGHVFTRSFFQQQYLCESGAVQEVANALYDVSNGGAWENIKKGLEMFQNPIEAVASLMYYPLDLSTVFTYVSSTSSIWFGGYQFQLNSHTANKIIYPDGFYLCGGVTIKPRTKDWRDVHATRIFVDLPYCGRYELDPAKYLGKYIKVIYYIDLHTGACIACLVEGTGTSRDGKCLDQFNGQMGVNCPITLTDFSSYANAQINTLLGNGGQAITAGQTLGETGAHAAVGAASGGGAALALGGAAVGGVALGALQGAKTVYGLSMNNINKFNQTRGGSTGMLNQYANQKPTFIFVYPDTDLPANFNAMNGTPSNAGGSISSFVGYFEADTVKLNMPGATESEKEKARALLMGGIYIQ